MAGNSGPPSTEQMLLVQKIYEEHRGLIYKIASERSRCDAEADDIVSETLIRLFKNAACLEGLNDRQIVGYLAKTLKSAAADLERKNRTKSKHIQSFEENPDVFPDYDSDPQESLYQSEKENSLKRHLYEALEELDQRDRLLLTGKYLYDKSDEELARQLGVKPSSIRMKLTRARNRAKKIIEKKEADGK